MNLPLSHPKNVPELDNQQCDQENYAILDKQNLIHQYLTLHLHLMIKQLESQFDYMDKIFVICWVWELKKRRRKWIKIRENFINGFKTRTFLHLNYPVLQLMECVQ